MEVTIMECDNTSAVEKNALWCEFINELTMQLQQEEDNLQKNATIAVKVCLQLRDQFILERSVSK